MSSKQRVETPAVKLSAYLSTEPSLLSATGFHIVAPCRFHCVGSILCDRKHYAYCSHVDDGSCRVLCLDRRESRKYECMKLDNKDLLLLLYTSYSPRVL